MAENHERSLAFPDFLQRGTSREQLCAAFFTESRRQIGGATKLHRKSGFGLHQLRNRCSDCRRVAGNEPEEVWIDRRQAIIECFIFVSASRLLRGASSGAVCRQSVFSSSCRRLRRSRNPSRGNSDSRSSSPLHLAELIDVAEHHNPSTRTIWERAKQKARELGLAKAAYYPELEGLAVFGDERLINPFPKPPAPRGYVMVEVPIVRPEVALE